MTGFVVATFAGPGAAAGHPRGAVAAVPSKAALIQIGACGVCGTDLHILKGHWPKPLPWPFTLGHELGGVIVEKGAGADRGLHGQAARSRLQGDDPAADALRSCYYCVHYPETANKCLTPVYYGRYLGFDKPPHLWGGWAEYVYVDLDELPGTKIYKLPDDMPLRLGALSEPLTSCIRAFNRADRCGGFNWGDTVVIQGSGPIGILAVAAAQEMGPAASSASARRRSRAWSSPAASVPRPPSTSRSTATPRGAHRARARHRRRLRRRPRHGLLGPSRRAGPEGIEFLRDGGTYVEMGQFTDAGSIETNWHRICTKDINVLGSWAFTANDLPLGVDMLYRARDKYPWLEMQTLYPFDEDGIARAVADAMAMRTVKSTIVPLARPRGLSSLRSRTVPATSTMVRRSHRCAGSWS